MLTFYPSLNVTAVQHRFNTESLILLHLAYTFGVHLYSTVLCLIAYLCFFDSFFLACSYTSSYIVLDTAVTKMQILTHSMNAGGMSRLVQPQECIITTEAC